MFYLHSQLLYFLLYSYTLMNNRGLNKLALNIIFVIYFGTR
jgi:hypothetical protein